MSAGGGIGGVAGAGVASNVDIGFVDVFGAGDAGVSDDELVAVPMTLS